MATTRRSRPGTDLELASNVRPEITKSPWYSRALTAIAAPTWVLVVVAILGVAEYFVLLSTSMSTGKYGKLKYPDTLTVVLFWFSVAYTVPALIVFASRRTHRFAYAKFRLLLIAAPLVLTVPLPAPLQSIYAWLLRNVLASVSISLVNIFWGLLGIVAIALQAIFIVVLCRFVGDDGSLDVNQQELKTLRDKGVNKEELGKRQRLEQRRKGVLETAEAGVAEATQKVEEAAAQRLEAQKAYDKMPQHEELQQLEAEEKEKRAAYDNAMIQIPSLTKMLQNPKLDPLDRKDAEEDLAEAKAKRAELRPYLREGDSKYLPAKIASLKKTIEESDERDKLTDAIAAHEAATTTQAEATKRAEARREEYDEAARRYEEEAAEVKRQEGRIAQLTSDIDEAQKSDQNVWRDFVFAPALLIASALFLYSAWYGYVLAHLS